MIEALRAALTEATGIAISPIPIIAIILMLISARARINAPLFVLGWVSGLVLTTSIGYFLIGARNSGSDSSGPSDLSLMLKLVFGLLFAYLAIMQFRKRPRPGVEAHEPKLFSMIDTLPVFAALGLGVALAALNVKNLPLALSAGASMAGVDIGDGSAVVVILLFSLIGSLTLILPTVIVLMLGDRVRSQITDLKDWLLRHNAAIMVTLFTILAAKSISGGLALFS